MAFSGFVLYDALSGAPIYPNMKSGTETTFRYVNEMNDGPAVTHTTFKYINGLGGGVR
ncbi:hypothetical protein KY312_01055 [Candidatus Woesearchaeota archaeon]|nr:hypothetical protein [Candidatus Woesearchaeota archaeon]